ncbi:hypothetical protein EUTSA_v10013207mg [Eutrema salsugineum]|uniref:Phorbol-ester/DAG-type domain-containing protein n=1 Tax=Eutrema salsugineum TaxID=72664 RepID=V4LR22_EUTSA|nr:hypothetical protein EUTSA_v10013207mg [Eutrema salsugineum]
MCENRNVGTDYYFCVGCDERYHKECVESPLQIKHPFHPRHSLQLFLTPRGCDYHCAHCLTYLTLKSYHCTSCNLNLDPICAMKQLPIVKNHPKRHVHPLTFFPRQDSLACNVCGVIKKFNPTYVCVPCDFVAHRNCIYFPFVIKISRHRHRVAFTSSLPSGEWFCGVCRREIDNHYGAYACQKHCNNYFVHTRCALRGDVWDGVELEGVPEEPDVVVEPFERIAEGIILHFTHAHQMRLEVSLVYDRTKICQACVLPIYEGSFYACMDQCDFILHDACANAPRRIHHPLHPHPLTLKAVAVTFEDDGQFHCNACAQRGCGFVYECQVEEECFQLDVMCASISEPFHYHGHKHPLFLALDPDEKHQCHICKGGYSKLLNCIECDFVVCFMCAALPYKVRYKHDKHFLTFCNWQEASDSDWCEICEGKLIVGENDFKFYVVGYGIEGTTGFYGCNECCTTLHIHCLLGKQRYMKPGQTIYVTMKSRSCRILHNNSNSRPICSGRKCQRRCLFNTVFKVDAHIFCCWECAQLFDEDDE